MANASSSSFLNYEFIASPNWYINWFPLQIEAILLILSTPEIIFNFLWVMTDSFLLMFWACSSQHSYLRNNLNCLKFWPIKHDQFKSSLVNFILASWILHVRCLHKHFFTLELCITLKTCPLEFHGFKFLREETYSTLCWNYPFCAVKIPRCYDSRKIICLGLKPVWS